MKFSQALEVRPTPNIMRHHFLTLAILSAVILPLGACRELPTTTVPDISRDYKPHFQQVLDNVAKFDKDSNAWPSHMLVYKGFLESRRTVTGAVGTSTKIEGNSYVTTHWELASLEDPYDIRRVRLLYRWVVGSLTFDELESRWNEIKDRALLDAGGKPILGDDGRPKYQSMALPINRDTRRDWFSQKAEMPLAAESGVEGLHRIWVTDENGAVEFSLAVLNAMANSRVRARWGDASVMVP